MKKYVSLILAVLMVVSLAACGKHQTTDTPAVSAPVYEVSGEPALPATPADKAATKTPSGTSVFEARHVRFEYPSGVLTATTSINENNGEDFLVSLTKAAAPVGSVPRIDVMSVSLNGLVESAVTEVAVNETKYAFEQFATSLLAVYYSDNKDDGNVDGMTIEFAGTEVSVDGNSKRCQTTAVIQPYAELPEMRASVNITGEGDYGIATICLYQSSLDEESVKVLDMVLSSVEFAA